MADWAAASNISGAGLLVAYFSVNCNATANTKHANYTQLIAATDRRVSGLYIYPLTHSANTVQDMLVDFAVGAEGSEVNIINNFFFEGQGTGIWYPKGTYLFPVDIPAGTRISANAQSTAAGGAAIINAALFYAGENFFSPGLLQGVDTYGAVTADSGGTSIDTDNGAGSEGDWVEVVSSTTRAMKGFYVALGNQKNTARTTAGWMIEIGVGAAGSEVSLVGDNYVVSHATIDYLAPCFLGPFWVKIPGGSRLSVRTMCDTADATDRLIDVIIYGMF